MYEYTNIFHKQRSKRFFTRSGFTLFEIMLSIAIMAILLVLIVFFIDPAKQFAKARNTRREVDVATTLTAISRNIGDNKGSFSCSSGALPTSSMKMASTGSSTYDIAPCLVPTYLDTLPYDPNATSSHYTSVTDYDTGYNIVRNATSGRITVNAPGAELGKTISITR